MKVIQFHPIVNSAGKMSLIGLGDDSKMYFWDATLGVWKPNWVQAQPIANRQARRAGKKA